MSPPRLRHFVFQEIYIRLNRVEDKRRHILKIIGIALGLLFALFLGVVALIASFNGISELLSGNLRDADTYASLASGLASVILVILTAWYSLETRRMVRSHEEARKREAAEQWYGETLAIFRQLEDAWDRVEKVATVRDFGEEEEYYVTDEELLQEVSSLISELFEQNSHRPSSVSNELANSILRIYSEWSLISSGGHTFTHKDNVLSEELPKIRARIHSESDIYGEDL